MVDKTKLIDILHTYGEKHTELQEVLNGFKTKEGSSTDTLKIKIPTKVFIESTNRCNLNCIFCMVEKPSRC